MHFPKQGKYSVVNMIAFTICETYLTMFGDSEIQWDFCDGALGYLDQ